MKAKRLSLLLLVACCGWQAAPERASPPGATAISLHLRDQPLSAALNALSAQAHIRFEKDNPRPQEPFPDPKISIDRDRAPFWEVMAEISRASGVSAGHSSGGRVTLFEDDGAWGRQPSIVRGPFRVSAAGIESQRTISLGRSPRQSSSTQLSLMFEVEANVIAVTADEIKLDVLSDQSGKPIPHPAVPRRGFFNYFERGRMTFPLQMTPGPDAVSIGVMRGTASIVVATESSAIEVDDITHAGEVKKELGDVTASISCKGTPFEYSVQVVLDYKGDDEIFAKRLRDALSTADVHLLDAEGREYPTGGAGGGSRGRLGASRTYRFPAHPRRQPVPGPAHKFVCQIAKSFAVAPVDFELKELPLP